MGLSLMLLLVGIIIIPSALASPVSVKSVTITSERLDYNKKEEGSFKIDKQAEWTSLGKARITFNLDTVMKKEEKDTDIIFVLDISGSMNGDKLTRVKEDSIELIEELMKNKNNKASLITFETDSTIVSEFTSDKDELINKINNLTTTGTTNYYKALVNVDTILKTYQKEKSKECIVLFLTDGYPNENTPNEVGEYKYLKEEYPYLTINAIQYEMGSDILEPIVKISDQQFIADMTNLNNVLFEASVAPLEYDKFEIIDYIDNRYFEIDSVDSINQSVGSIKLEYEKGVPKIIWNIDNLRSGRGARLTIDVNLKKEYLDKGGLYPTNIKEEIKTSIAGITEDITSSKTPILASHYQVIYDANTPDDCTLSTDVPVTENRKVFETVEISNKKLTCGNYQFKGWKVTNKNVKMINKDYFIMPESDVIIKAEWAKVNVLKSMDGEIYTVPPSIMKKVIYSQYTEIWKYKSSITKIIFENKIRDIERASESFDISEAKNETVMAHMVLNDDTSTYTVYIQGNEKVIANENSSNLFYSFSKLTSIEGLEYFDTSQVTTMSSMFNGCRSLTSLDLSNFNTSKVTDMSGMFSNCSSLVSLDLSNFNTSQVTNMSYMFSSCSSLTSLDLSSFNTSQVTTMQSMFAECSTLKTTITILNPNITSYSNMFYDAATNNGSLIKVNYTTETSDLVDQMIATKSLYSNVIKGELF